MIVIPLIDFKISWWDASGDELNYPEGSSKVE